MARSTRKSIAGSAVSAARKVIRRRPTSPTSVPATTTKTTTKASVKKNSTPAKKVTPARKTAKKAAPAKAAATKTAKKSAGPAKKAASAKKTAPAKKTASSKKTAPTKKAVAKKAAPAKKAAAKKAAPAKKAAARKTAPATKAAPAKKSAPAKKTAARKSTKKTAPKKSAPATKVSSLPVGAGESAWTKAEIKEVRDELTDIRDRVARTLEAQEAELAGLMRDAGDGAGHDQADMGATSFERDHELTVVNNEREKLAQIDRALARIADGTYGICESCGNPIGKMRVMAFPRATLCLTCKQREERR